MKNPAGKWNKENINEMMQKSPKFLERAVVMIHTYQTNQEQSAEQTLENNGVGFNGVDAPFLSSLVSWINKKKVHSVNTPEGQRLTSAQQLWALKKMKKYAGQIARIANEMAAKSAAATSPSL